MLNYLLGWNDMGSHVKNELITRKKTVCLFPHTTSWDTISMITQIIPSEELHGKFWVSVRKGIPQQYIGRKIFPKYFRALETPSPDEKKIYGDSGFVERTIETVRNEDGFHILISPEGSRKKSEWKSGYYWIAKKLMVPIMVIGFDYGEKKVKMPLIIDVDWKKRKKGFYKVKLHRFNEDQTSSIEYLKINKLELQYFIEDELMSAMSNIMPLNPENSYVIPREDLNDPSLLTMDRKIMFIMILLFVVFFIIYIWFILKGVYRFIYSFILISLLVYVVCCRYN